MSRGSFWLRAAVGFLVCAGLGAAAASWALKAYFPEAKVRAMVTDAARRQLGREVRLAGLDLGLRGLSLRGLEIAEAPGFSGGTFVKADLVRVRPSWRALLRRRLVVASMSAEGLDVRVVKRADGSFNFSTLGSTTAAPAPAPSAPSGGAPAPELDVRRLLVTGSSLEYDDQTGGPSWSATGLNLDVDGFGLAAPFAAAGSVRLRGRAAGRPIDAAIAVQARVDLARGSRAAFSADVGRLVVEEEGLRLESSGRVARLDAPQISFDATLSAAGKRLLAATGTAKSSATLEIDAKLQSEALDTTLLARLAPKAGIPALNLPAMRFAIGASASGADAVLRRLTAEWSGGRLDLTGSARGLGGSSPALEGRATFGFDAPRIEPGQYPFLKLPPRLGLPAARVEGDLALSGGDLAVKSLLLKPAQGTLKITGSVRRAFSEKPALDLAADAALALPAFRAGDLPFSVGSLPASLTVPPVRVEGTIKLSGDDVRLVKLALKTSAGAITLDGAAAPEPDLDVALDLSLPALTDKDLPFPGVPAGLQFPASRWDGSISYSPRATRLRGLRARVGHNDVAADGAIASGASGAFDLLLKCRSFSLEEITGLTPATRDDKLKGSGFFAVSITGTKDKPVYAGKAQFKGVGATLASLSLADFAGTLSIEQSRIDVPNLTGKVADGTLKMNLTIKDYMRAPNVLLDAKLDRFDLGGYLDAKSRLAAQMAASAPTASTAAAGAAPAAAPKPIRTSGNLEIGALTYPNANLEQIKASWDLSGITADLKQLGGQAKFEVGGGKLKDIGKMATQSILLKVLISPLLIVQKIGRIGGIRLFPDFNDITLRAIIGDYAFKDGLMTLNKCEMDSDAADVTASGTIGLSNGALDLLLTAQVANVAPIDVDVKGTIDAPKSEAHVLKSLIKGLLKPQ